MIDLINEFPQYERYSQRKYSVFVIYTTSRTKTLKYNTLEKYLQAEVKYYLGGLRKYDDSSTEDYTNRDNSDNEKSTEKRDEILKMKDRTSVKYSMKTPTRKNVRKSPTPPYFLVKKNPNDLYERKDSDS